MLLLDIPFGTTTILIRSSSLGHETCITLISLFGQCTSGFLLLHVHLLFFTM